MHFLKNYGMKNGFAGGYLWKWFIDYEKVGGFKNHMFAPQNKPVESIVRANYSIVH